MISPRRTRLVRVADLHAFRHAIRVLCAPGSSDIERSRAVVVPTRGAARLLAPTLEGSQAAPAIVTREELYELLHRRLPDAPPRLSGLERDALAQAAARLAASASEDQRTLFQLRPRLVAEMLRFYDQLRRQSQRVQRFEELIEDALGSGAASDRGTARVLGQTRFLARTFREYERLTRESGACDEHMLRERLMSDPSRDPVRHVVVTVADWIADPGGLFVADFDLLSRIPGLDAIDLVCTEPVLASGFHKRIHEWWPGIEETNAAAIIGETRQRRPVLVSPAAERDRWWFTFRDREEELIAIARQAVERADEKLAVVFKRPLPYLYLAPATFGAAGISYQTFDALPLAAEPTAAAIDAVLDAVETSFTRGALVALLRSPHFRFIARDRETWPRAVSALDAALSGARYLGGLERLDEIASHVTSPAAAPALEMARAIAHELSPLGQPAPASEQIRRLLAFVTVHFRPLDQHDPFALRERQARSALVNLLSGLAAAHAAYHDPVWTIGDLAAAVRRWIEDHIFAPESRGTGVCFLDDQAARYGDFDSLAVVGLVENEWPERPRRNIFYSSALLKALGWASETDRRAAADARLLDLVASASARVTLSTFALEDEAIVSRSVQLDEVPRAQLALVPEDDAPPPSSIFPDEALAADPARIQGPIGFTDGTRAWFEMRLGRTPNDTPEFHGHIGPQPEREWSVSALETYLGCPFRFFARHVLRLQEEPDDEEVMDPRRQGQFVHEVFEAFFTEWQAGGRRGITAGNLDDARILFADVVERELTKLPEGEAGLERTRLLGSSAAAGLGEAVFRMEAERPIGVLERLLEHRLDGDLTIETSTGSRVVRLRGKADRLDLLEDGTFRLIDYKLGWPPNKAKALQLPVYGLCAERRLEHRHGRVWTLGEAVYLAFKGPRRVVPLFSDAAERGDVLAKAQQRLANTIDAIERGEFPPAPDDVFRCETCDFAAVCRKDYEQPA